MLGDKVTIGISMKCKNCNKSIEYQEWEDVYTHTGRPKDLDNYDNGYYCDETRLTHADPK